MRINITITGSYEITDDLDRREEFYDTRLDDQAIDIDREQFANDPELAVETLLHSDADIVVRVEKA